MSPCTACGAKCCKYVAIETEDPTTSKDFDTTRWMLSHENLSIFIDGDGWHLLIPGRCRDLDENDRCKIYDYRPKICRTHKAGECESEGGFDYNYIFHNPEDLAVYMLEKGIKFPKRWAKQISNIKSAEKKTKKKKAKKKKSA